MFSNGIDQIEADEQLTTLTMFWALTDHLGSVRDVVDNSGAVQNHIVYDAFGNITSQSNSSVIFRYGYTAREFDAEIGLQYNRARYIDTFTGRFISEDPIGFAGGDTNLSRYVFNSPVIYNDPSGNIAQAVVIPAAVIIGGAILLLDSINRAIEVNQRGSRTIPLAPNYNPFVDKPEPPILFIPPGSPPKLPSRTETYPSPQPVDPRPLISPAGDLTIQRIFDDIRNFPNCDKLSIPPFLSIEGIYDFLSSSGKRYVGQSNDIERRLQEHLNKGKVTQEELDRANKQEILSGKTQREIAEQRKIDSLGGIDNLQNKRNLIGKNRQGLLNN